MISRQPRHIQVVQYNTVWKGLFLIMGGVDEVNCWGLWACLSRTVEKGSQKSLTVTRDIHVLAANAVLAAPMRQQYSHSLRPKELEEYQRAHRNVILIAKEYNMVRVVCCCLISQLETGLTPTSTFGGGNSNAHGVRQAAARGNSRSQRIWCTA